MRALLTAIGLALALSAGAQTTDEKQDANQGKATTEENVKAQPGSTVKKSVQPAERDKTRASVDENVNQGARVNGGERMRGEEKRVGGGEVSHSTTVFRNGRETHESLALHRGFRERTDVHFGIGTHPRDWWLRTYSIVLIEGCHYYLADNGCWYPAYGFDPTCNFPDGVVYCD